jgi:hypothetical protein
MLKLKNCIFLVFSLFSICVFSQDEEFEDPNEFHFIQAKHSYIIDFLLPVSVKNKAFKGVMQGLVRSGIAYQYNFKNGISLGLGYQYTFFQINKFKTPQLVFGGLHINSPYVKIGYDKFYSERFGTEINCRIGYSMLSYFSDSLKRLGSKNYNKQNYSIEPSFALVLTGSKNTSYKWIFAYAFLAQDFNLNHIGLNANAGYVGNDLTNPIRYLSFGFSFSHYFRQRD